MKNRLFLDKTEYTRFFNTIILRDNTRNKQYTKLIKWCFDNGFFHNLTDEDIDNYYIWDCLPVLKNNGMCIGSYELKDGILVGIDPSKCFDKTSRSSILVKLPLTKRDETRFYNLLNTLLDSKQKQTKAWKREAPALWYGEYIKLGDIY